MARAAGRGVVYDKKWNKEWKGEISDLERKIILEKQAGPLDLKKDLGENYLSLFRDYLGKEFPKYITSFPYVRFYRDKGYKVIGAPLGLGEYQGKFFGLSNGSIFLGNVNIEEFSRRCIKEKSEGIITTAWVSFPPEIFYLGLIATSQFTWKGAE